MGGGGKGVDDGPRLELAVSSSCMKVGKQTQISPLAMEDSQPNEVRLSRKGSTIIPRVRISRPYPSKKPKWQPSSHDLVRVHLHLPRENAGNHDARKRWIEDQKYRLWTDRRLSVVSFKYLDHDNNRVQFTCRSQAIGHYGQLILNLQPSY